MKEGCQKLEAPDHDQRRDNKTGCVLAGYVAGYLDSLRDYALEQDGKNVAGKNNERILSLEEASYAFLIHTCPFSHSDAVHMLDLRGLRLPLADAITGSK